MATNSSRNSNNTIVRIISTIINKTITITMMFRFMFYVQLMHHDVKLKETNINTYRKIRIWIASRFLIVLEPEDP